MVSREGLPRAESLFRFYIEVLYNQRHKHDSSENRLGLQRLARMPTKVQLYVLRIDKTYVITKFTEGKQNGT